MKIIKLKPWSEETMKKLLAICVLSIFALSAVGCEKEDKEKRSKRRVSRKYQTSLHISM